MAKPLGVLEISGGENLDLLSRCRLCFVLGPPHGTTVEQFQDGFWRHFPLGQFLPWQLKDSLCVPVMSEQFLLSLPADPRGQAQRKSGKGLVGHVVINVRVSKNTKIPYHSELQLAAMKDRLTVSFIDFLNSVPLGWSFLKGQHSESIRLILDVPSECARHLASGEADVGLIPVIEYQRIPGLQILPGISISSREEVRSVIFVSRVPISEVRNVAVDTSSRTSVALLRILFNEFYRRPEVVFYPHPPRPVEMLEKYESALIIGNPALQVPRHPYRFYDLAREWHRFTGLPFVFAFWAVRKGVSLGNLAESFYQARVEGLAALDEISLEYSQRLGLTPGEVQSYLRDCLDYSLGSENLAGLRTFYRMAASHGLIGEVREPDFYPLDRVEV